MPTGGCFCGNIRVEWSGDPEAVILCHCADCRKISGGMFSNNFVIPSSNFKVTSGKPKDIKKVADSGKQITNCFCGDCGTTLFRWGDSFGGIDGMRIVKIGIADDVNLINNNVPGTELYAPERIKWVHGLDGAKQVDAMS